MLQKLFGFGKSKTPTLPPEIKVDEVEYKELLENSLQVVEAISDDNPNKERFKKKLKTSFSKYKKLSPEALQSRHMQLASFNRRMVSIAKRK
jgi:hypothetical protein